MDSLAASVIALAVLVVAVLILVWATASSYSGAPAQRPSRPSRPSRPEGLSPPDSPYIASGPLKNFPPRGFFGQETCGPCDNYFPQPEWKFMAPQAHTGTNEGVCCR